MHTPHLPPKIPSLRDLIEGKADKAVAVPAELPAETPKSEAVNSHQLRYSDSAQHEHLHSNIIPEIMSYTQEPFPDQLSERTLRQYGQGAPFRHRETIRGWVENIFVKNGNDKFLELGTTVEKAVKEGDEWVLTLRKEGPGKDYWWREWFDALVVATGHYNVPWFPEIPGLAEYDERFPERIIHSKHFRGAEKFRGKVSDWFCSTVKRTPRTLTMLPAGYRGGWISLIARSAPRDPSAGTTPCLCIHPWRADPSFWLGAVQAPSCVDQKANQPP